MTRQESTRIRRETPEIMDAISQSKVFNYKRDVLYNHNHSNANTREAIRNVLSSDNKQTATIDSSVKGTNFKQRLLD